MAYQDADGLLDLPPPSLVGPHQLDNAGLAIAAALALGDPRIDPAAIARGVASAVWPARMQRLDKGPFGEIAGAVGSDLWLDGGHNPHAARAVAKVASDMRARDGRPLTLIVGLLQRKDAAGVFAAFRGLGARLIATGFGSDLAAPPEALAAAAGGQVVETEPDPMSAVRRAVAWAEAGQPAAPHIIVCGSLYLAGEMLASSRDTWPV
jgi:dihydrofolate synthase/folylpolyglutamate synthase